MSSTKRLAAATLPRDEESALLAKICASVVNDREKGEVAALAIGVDWTRLLALARRHRVTALVAYGLRKSGVIIPAELANHLRNEERTAQHAELATLAEVRRLVHGFEADGLRVILLKGIAVSLAAFGRLGLRHNRDIDLLVDEKNVARAEMLLSVEGYVRVDPELSMSADAERRWRVSHKDSVFVHPDRHTIVELHWRLFENRYLLPLPRDVWDKAATVRFPGFSSQGLPLNFDLVYLCVHGAQHAWSRLKWLVDIDGLLSAMSLDEQIEALMRAKALGVVRAVEQALLLREEVLERPIDPAVRIHFPHDRTSRVLMRLGLRCLRDGGVAEIETQRFATTAKSISHYWLRRGTRYWFSELRFDLTNGAESSLPSSLWWMAPFARPLIWATKVRRRAKLV